MTNKERFATVQKNIETIKAEKYTAKKDEIEILKAVSEKSKKDELEKALAVADEVIKRNLERIAKKTAEEKAKADAEAKAKEEAKKTEKVASLKKATSKKKEAPKAEPKKEIYPDSYETSTLKLDSVTAWKNEDLTNQTLLIGRQFLISSMSKNYVYSIKEHELNEALLKAKDNSPFIKDIDLYKVIAENDFLYIIQSLYTDSFSSIRKDVLKKEVDAKRMALYKHSPMEKKAEPKKKAPRKKAQQ